MEEMLLKTKARRIESHAFHDDLHEVALKIMHKYPETSDDHDLVDAVIRIHNNHFKTFWSDSLQRVASTIQGHQRLTPEDDSEPIDSELEALVLKYAAVVQRCELLDTVCEEEALQALGVVTQVHDLVFVTGPDWLLRFHELVHSGASVEAIAPYVDEMRDMIEQATVTDAARDLLWSDDDAEVLEAEMESFQADMTQILAPLFSKMPTIEL